MFGQIAPTEFDLNFRVFGIPVRVHPVFWLSSAYLAWSFTGGQGDRLVLPKLLIGTLCIFVAILVHELGHALMNRRFGWESEIVLYFFGGYATSMRHSTWRDIAVSAAGPGAGFLLFGAAWIGLEWIRHTGPFGSPEMFALLAYALGVSYFINLVWNVANLLPVEPLDGGQISRELFLRYSPGDGMARHLQLSMLVAGGVAAYCIYCYWKKLAVFGLDPVFLGLMFGFLCFQNFQMLEQRRRGGGPRAW